ncbi:hypothetical protein D3C74_350960 [compost metagenome]
MREVVETFHKNGLLNHDEYERFIEVIKYRNLVFHGHLDTVDKSKVDETVKLNDVVNQIEDKIESRFKGE